MNGEGAASSVLAAITKKNIDKKNQPETNKKISSNKQQQNTLSETIPLLKEDINNINNSPIATNFKGNCCPSCIIL